MLPLRCCHLHGQKPSWLRWFAAEQKRIFFGASHHDSRVPSMATFPISPLNVVVHFCVYACSSDGGRSLSSCPIPEIVTLLTQVDELEIE